MSETPKRRFAPVPVETSSKSTRSSKPRQAAEPEDTTTPKRPPRKFAVEPVETTAKKNHHVQVIPPSPSLDEKSKKPARKFAVEPVETTTKKSKQDDSTSKPARTTRKFAVEPVGTTTKSGGKHENDEKRQGRFAPQPIEETRRRRRSYEEPKRRDSELDETPADLPIGVRGRSPTRTLDTSLLDDSMPRRSPLPHERRKERTESITGNARSHSFMLPDLATIESSESEPSEQGSPDRSSDASLSDGSPLTISDGNTDSKQFSRYMKALEKQRAEQAMQERALAAFANSDYHQPVEHYVDEESDAEVIIDDRPSTWEGHEDDDGEGLKPAPRTTERKATSKHSADEAVKSQREQSQKQKDASSTGVLRTEQAQSPWWNPSTIRDVALPPIDSEMSNMLQRARPPMLGRDLRFPRSKSPEPARFDVTQGSHALRNQMCYLSEQAETSGTKIDPQNGLWGGAMDRAKTSSGEGKGLWGGFCAESPSDETPKKSQRLPSGLVTPAVFEKANPFDEEVNRSLTGNSLRPPPPPHARSKMQRQGIVVQRIESVLNSDDEVDRLMHDEYPDTFITQVFNYLSLGYPSLARAFDEELSKISSIPMAELRGDDAVAKKLPKGYIRIGDDFSGRGDGTDQNLQNGGCARWRALKMYIREWAKQEKGMVEVHAAPWGAAARKGSWAW